MKTVIYYFSGTGNTLFVAKDIAESLKADLVPVASLINQDEIGVEADVIGIVFPVYYGDLPLLLRDFTGKLTNIENTYIFAICTFGGSAGESFERLKNIIGERGGKVGATYGIHMPQNAFYKFWEKHEPLYRNWRNKVKTVVINTNEQKKGAFYTNFLFDLIFNGIQAYVKPRYKKSFARLSGSSEDLSVEELIHLNDTSFSVTEECTGCGLCARVCPVNNIEMVNKKPAWRHRCENCIACYNYCPSRAILSGIPAKGYYYHHPDITVHDIIGQKRKEG